MTREFVRRPASGGLMLALVIVSLLLLGWLLVGGVRSGSAGQTVLAALGLVVTMVLLGGFFIVHPNQAAILVFFGKYAGSAKTNGFFWVNPFTVRKKISLRARTLNMQKLKVNDRAGNPIEIAAVVVWQVENTAQAAFDVDDFESYVTTQSESALRHLATTYRYDTPDDSNEPSLRGAIDVVSTQLERELSERLSRAGVKVIEARLSHLAYSAEIAGAMLQRQQADAIIAARAKIVEGAVLMVEDALRRLAEHKVIELDDERKAHMVSNLLVVLCSHSDAQPIVNAGTIY